tara:strand:+ start:15109 stop:15384 length:276 start_codon:yes stop_codon:yes gene_type:complete
MSLDTPRKCHRCSCEKQERFFIRKARGKPDNKVRKLYKVCNECAVKAKDAANHFNKVKRLTGKSNFENSEIVKNHSLICELLKQPIVGARV